MSTSKKGFGAGSGFGGKGKSGGGRKAVRDRTLPYKSPHEDPFANLPEPTGDLEQDTNDEVQALGEAFAGFKERAKQEQKRFQFAVDADFWFGVCFRSTEDKVLFLKALERVPGLYREQHVSGYELADILGLDVDWVDRE